MKEATLYKWTLDLSFDKPPLSLNQRMHWAKKAKLTKEIRREVYIRAKAARLKPSSEITVGLVYRPRDKRRRDPSNLIATQKPILDGLVDAGLVPDDTPEYVNELMPKILPPVKGEPSRCWVEIMLH